MKKLFTLIVCLVPALCWSQMKKISGIIIDSESYNPIENANIYISGSSRGTNSDPDGEFELEVPEGIEEVFITHVSYQTYILTFTNATNYRIGLTHRVNQLSEVAIHEEVDKEWKRNLNKFEKSFLGNSINAGKCKIINPWVIEFKEEKQNFLASATEPLEIENRALGFRLFFYLGHFSKQGLTVSYSGKYRFEQLDSSDEKEKRRWDKNREKVYLGSRRHFLYALANEELSTHGFVVHFADLNAAGDQFYVTRLAMEEDLIVKENNQLYIDYKGYIRILYTKGLSDSGIQSQTSYLFTPQIASLFKNGLSTDDEIMQEFGLWSKSRIAELLPVDYRPKKNF